MRVGARLTWALHVSCTCLSTTCAARGAFGVFSFGDALPPFVARSFALFIRSLVPSCVSLVFFCFFLLFCSFLWTAGVCLLRRMACSFHLRRKYDRLAQTMEMQGVPHAREAPASALGRDNRP